MADFGFGWPVRRHVAEKSVEVTEEFPPLGVVARFLFSRMAHRDISGFVVLDEASVCGRRARKWSGGGEKSLKERSRSATPPPSRSQKEL